MSAELVPIPRRDLARAAVRFKRNKWTGGVKR
jgi:hypothetical protein